MTYERVGLTERRVASRDQASAIVETVADAKVGRRVRGRRQHRVVGPVVAHEIDFRIRTAIAVGRVREIRPHAAVLRVVVAADQPVAHPATRVPAQLYRVHVPRFQSVDCRHTARYVSGAQREIARPRRKQNDNGNQRKTLHVPYAADPRKTCPTIKTRDHRRWSSRLGFFNVTIISA